VGGAFMIGAQTSYSMVRKTAPRPGDNVLVTAAKSNTSLFAIQALRKYGANVYALSTSHQNADKFHSLGVQELIVFEPQGGSELASLAKKIGGFDIVIDPFYDIYFPVVFDSLAYGARYVSCGVLAQGMDRMNEPRGNVIPPELLSIMVIKNIT